MTACAELEIGLDRKAPKTWSVQLRFKRPGSEADEIEDAKVRFDLQRLRDLVNADDYGHALTDSIFKKGSVVERLFDHARSLAGEHPLRVRLLIRPSAPELHAVWWETLRDPTDGSALLLDERIWFSRYLASRDWPAAVLYSKPQLRALVAIANPSDLERWRLPPIDVEGELARFTSSFAGIPVTQLASDGTATLDGITSQLRGGRGHNVLYLVCHGYLAGDEPQVLLEDRAGKGHRVPGTELVDALRDLEHRPCLVVLASCESAGGEQPGEERAALAALGPRMAAQGVPAVLAMQGRASIRTLERFVPVFFEELNTHGQIDRAMTRARAEVRGQHDWWVPTLFTRLRDGRLWRQPGFASEGDFARWPGLCSDIANGRCTPVLGPGLTDAFIGSRQEIARGWAHQHHYPLTEYRCEDLPHVAQYLAVEQGLDFPRDKLARYIRQELLRRYRQNLEHGVGAGPLNDLLRAVGAYRRSIDPAEPHAVLARMPLRLFVTAHPAALLEDALRAEGKDPQVAFCRWKEALDGEEPDAQDHLEEPTVERPLVYHLLGSLEHPDTLVLTEDDYFDYLVAVTKNDELIPRKVTRALADSSLLFLGFGLDEWDFRVLFRSVIARQGTRRRYRHVAVQINPGEDRTIDPERARRHLDRYFSEQISVSIYWGSPEEFVRELDTQWRQAPP